MPTTDPVRSAGRAAGLSLRLLGLLSAVGLGVAVAQLLIWGPLARAPAKVITFRPQIVGEEATEFWTLPTDSKPTPESSAHSPPAKKADVDGEDPWLPRIRPDHPLRGASGAFEPHSVEWERVGLALPTDPAAQEEGERAVHRSLHREYLDSVTASLERRRARGSEPWEAQRFQFVATVGLPRNVTLTGRDFLPFASPSASVRWFEMARSKRLPDRLREDALRVLADLESARKREFGVLASRAHELIGRREFERRCVAYALAEGRLLTFQAGDEPSVDAAIERIRSTDERVLAEAARLVKE